ncbi:MAG: glycoside hydrolase [Phycisphaerae bacterium]
MGRTSMTRAMLAVACLPVLVAADGPAASGAVATDEAARSVRSLAGEWRFRLDPDDAGVRDEWFKDDLPDRIRLPGSLQEQGFGRDVSTETKWTGGIKDRSWFNADRYAPYRKPGNVKVPFWLQPATHYVGPAWYQRTVAVPEGWNGRRIVLHLQRCHWTTTVWVDGTKAGSRDSLSVPHEYDLTAHLAPGSHRLTIRVDNRMHVNVGRNAHSVTDHTQSNWNGIIGRIDLRAGPPVWIEDLQVYPDVAARQVRVEMVLGNATGKAGRDTVRLDAVATNTETAHDPAAASETVARSADDRTAVTLLYPLGAEAQEWDEFHPALYRMTVTLEAGEAGTDRREVVFGLREIRARGTQLVLNGRPLFLRGTLECCIFPKTGYPPTDVEAWKRIIRRCQACGLNHMRFHSWCPPEAAFTAADELGFTLQAEGPFWTAVGRGKPIDKYIYAETDRIRRAYGNHPSFLLMAYGNEPGGPGRGAAFLGPWVTHCKETDPRRLYTGGSGWPPIPENQFHVTPAPRIHQWGEGLKDRLNARPPETRTDYREVVARHDVPVVGHEIGQWCAYPNFEEIEKYTGVLKPRNFKIFREFLEKAHMGDQARDFLMASGRLQMRCYKEEVESALRTPGFGGFQLLDLHDFPGQGTALVGVLDPFWDPKPYMTPEAYRRFCGPTVPLVRIEKRIYTAGDWFRPHLYVAHYGPDDIDAELEWRLEAESGNAVASGTFDPWRVPTGTVTHVSYCLLRLRAFTRAQRLRFVVGLEGTRVQNHWDLWIYPESIDTRAPDGVLLVRDLEGAAATRLAEGGRVVLMVPPGRVKTDVALGFTPIFWNTAWTGGQAPHTLGLLCDPEHPALEKFPTESHTTWQWWDLVRHASAMVLDGMPPDLRPIVQVVPDWFDPKRLGLVFEAKVGQGRLLVTSIDLVTDLENRPVARQMRHSLLTYAASDAFAPAHAVTLDQVRGLVKD